MLIIRQQQIQHFIAATDDELVTLVRQIVRDADPERVADYDDEKLTPLVKFGVERAKSHGLTLAENVAAFVAVMFEIAPNFDEQEQIKFVLTDANFSPDERFGQLWERVDENAWKEAENLYAAQIWFPAQ